MNGKRAVIIHRITKTQFLETPLKAGQDLSQSRVLNDAKKDAHRYYYGWYRGLKKMGWQVTLIEKPSYVVPECILRLNPAFYVKALKVSKRKPFFPFRLLDSLVFRLHVLFLILVYKPRILLFGYNDISKTLNFVCRIRKIKTISYFGVPPRLKTRAQKNQVAEYDHVFSGYDLPKLWPEIQNQFYRIFLGPSEDSKYLEDSEYPKDIDVCIIGGFGGELFETRAMIVNQLLQRLKEHGVEMRVYGYEVGEGLGEDFLELKQALRGRLFGDRFYEMIKRSKIMLNIPNDDHIRIGATRPQGLMEAAASRTFQIAYNAGDTRAIFDPDAEIVLFDSVDDLVDKIKYYLEHEEERDRIAQNAYEKFLRAYTGEKQIQMMIECLGL